MHVILKNRFFRSNKFSQTTSSRATQTLGCGGGHRGLISNTTYLWSHGFENDQWPHRRNTVQVSYREAISET